MASASSGTNIDRLLRSLELTGWTIELTPAGEFVTGLATRPDGGRGPLRVTAFGRNRPTVALLLFEQACGRVFPDYRRAG